MDSTVESPRPEELVKRIKLGYFVAIPLVTHPPETMKVRFSIFIAPLYSRNERDLRLDNIISVRFPGRAGCVPVVAQLWQHLEAAPT
jgi:hypothetical protein